MKRLFSKKNRALLQELVRTDFKLRYQNSILGYAWSLLRPLFLFLILYVVFVKFLRLGGDIPHFPIYLLLGIVLWNFFGEMTSQSVTAIVARGDLIRKIKIPRWIIIFATSISAIINLSLNLIVVAAFMYFNGLALTGSSLWLLLILAQIYILALGTSLFLAAAYVKYRDISYIWEIIMQGLFYLTPILYPVSLITNVTLQKLLFLNPMAQAIQDARYTLVSHQSITAIQAFGRPWLVLIPLALTAAALIIGVLYFRKESKYFAENI